MIFFMLTNIITESSELLCCGPEAREKILSAYDLPEDTETIMLRGVVSRKKTTGAYAGGRAAAVKKGE